MLQTGTDSKTGTTFTYAENRDTLIRNPDTETLSGSVVLNTSPRKAWQLVGNFAGFDKFITGLERIEMTGEGVRSVRKKFFSDGNVVLEQLNSWDDTNMVMTWSMVYTSFDIGNLWASMRVETMGEERCKVIWDIAGEPWNKVEGSQAGFNDFVTGFLAMAMENIKNILDPNTH